MHFTTLTTYLSLVLLLMPNFFVNADPVPKFRRKKIPTFTLEPMKDKKTKDDLCVLRIWNACGCYGSVLIFGGSCSSLYLTQPVTLTPKPIKGRHCKKGGILIGAVGPNKDFQLTYTKGKCQYSCSLDKMDDFGECGKLS